jgi:type IV secretory pathway TraG/TraD family ATPase VirD4
MSFVTTDTKGDLYRNYAGIAKDKYGYEVAVIDLRNPTRSDGNNLLHLVNRYMDAYLNNPQNLAFKARAEKYAKITAKTIISSGGFDSAMAGQNAFFYDAAEGLLTSVILLIAEYCEPKQRHIVSVFKLIQDLLAPSGVKGRTLFQLLLAHLPDEHKTKWFAGAALNSAEQAMQSVLSASRSRRVSIVAIIQSFAQLEKNYGREGSAIIIDNCQDTVFGGFAPNSESAQILSKAMGSKTVMSGSVSRGKNDPSQSLQMIERPLMTSDELKSMPKGRFIVTKTGAYPMRTRLKLFTEWGITFGKPYEIAEQSAREVEYADRRRVEEEIIRRHSVCVDVPEEEEVRAAASGGLLHTPNQEPEALTRTKALVRIE